MPQTDIRAQDQLGFWIKQVQIALRTELDNALAVHGMTAARCAALTLLAESEGPPTSAELAVRVGVTAQTMHRVVRDLEAAALVVRQARPGRVRERSIFLTDAGRRTLATAQAEVLAVEERATVGLSPEERDMLLTLLRRVARNLDDSL